MQQTTIQVSSEIGTLRRLLIHSPDSGLGQVVPSKAQDWLFEDIVHLNTLRKEEYDYYLKLLFYFLDPERIQGRLLEIDADSSDRAFYKPDHPLFHHSDKIIEIQVLLEDILKDESTKNKMVAAVCAIERCTYHLQLMLLKKSAQELAKIMLSGSFDDEHMIFAPIPNLIFTRDLGIVINKHILLNKPAKKARQRENLIMCYILFNHRLFENYRHNLLEIPNPIQHFLRPGEEEDQKATLEGGDVMVVSPQHVIIGCSERTSPAGAAEAMNLLFKHEVVEKVSIVKIPAKRDFMHIDTLFTQINRNTWVILGSVSRKKTDRKEAIDYITSEKQKPETEILQFTREQNGKPKRFDSIESLLNDISRNDLKCTKSTQFIYSGNQVFPYDAREQWTDSCNLLALKEGVVLGYDRNEKTIAAFEEKGFRIVKVKDLIESIESGQTSVENIENTLILMPSAELSRARGGFHCMSLPLLRDPIV